MKKFLFLLGILLTTMFAINNVNAEINIIDESESTRTAEKREREEAVDNSNSNLRAGLTVPKEGDYDANKTVDKYNSSGKLTQRNFYKGSVLRQISYFTYDSKLAIYKLTKKVLYWSNGKTIERERFYSYSGKTIYNTQTKRYYDNAKLNWHLYYDGSTGKNKEWRYYDTTGTYYTSKGYYKNGILNSREYWKGSSGNYIVEYGLFNSTGEHWTKLTRYYNSAKAINEVINYTGAKTNKRKDSTGYRLDGSKDWYLTYDSAGDKKHTIRYDSKNIKTYEAGYYPELNTWEWQTVYNTSGKKLYTNRYDEDNVRIQIDYYQESNDSLLKQSIQYFEDAKTVSKKMNYDNSGKITESFQYFEEDGSLEEHTIYFNNWIVMKI